MHITLDEAPTRLLVDDAARNAAIAALAQSYAAAHLRDMGDFDRQTVLHGFRLGCRAGLTLVSAGADSADAVVRAKP